jgi:hypothetical protein
VDHKGKTSHPSLRDSRKRALERRSARSIKIPIQSSVIADGISIWRQVKETRILRTGYKIIPG